ncbi:uncharacterized protein [Rutidosis leptorrhynchoides]|uniref:uncharacterized protein n=1 Tax=Rutidosis leptorrhynchoides TaxID=125765 RepID=UPI003A98D135
MQPPNPYLYNPYSYHPSQPTSQFGSHSLPQNPNPNPIPNYPPIHYESHYPTAQVDHNPPGVDSYYHSSLYHVNHAGGVYIDHRAAALSYSHAVSAVPPSTYATDSVVYDWAAKEPDLRYDYSNTVYTTATTVSQDASLQHIPAIAHVRWIDPNPNPTVQPRMAWKKIPKKAKISQSAWCEVCKLTCNSTDVLLKHKMGKKHLKNLESLTKPTSVATPSIATTSVTTNFNLAVQSNRVIGPMENPMKGNLGKKKKVETPQDLAAKKRKVLEGGAAANLVRTCQICNVVCNSDTVYRFHIAGQKHASMFKKLQQAPVV